MTDEQWWPTQAGDGPPANPLLHAAHRYMYNGWFPIPVARETKKPTLPNWPEAAKHLTYEGVEALWDRADPPNIGLVTGIVFDVLDIDGQGGRDSLERYLNGRPWKPTGPVAITGGGGRHILFRNTGYASSVGLLPNVDFRGKGGQVVAPPSVHATGKPYRWMVDYPWEMPLPLAPPWLIDLLERAERVAAEPPAKDQQDNGSVSEALSDMGISFRAEGGLFVFECPTGRHSDSDWSAKTGLGEIADRKWLCFGCGSWGDAKNIRQNCHVFDGAPYENVTLIRLSGSWWESRP